MLRLLGRAERVLPAAVQPDTRGMWNRTTCDRNSGEGHRANSARSRQSICEQPWLHLLEALYKKKKKTTGFCKRRARWLLQ